MFFTEIDILFSISPITYRFFKQFAKCFAELRQIDPVLRSFRSRDARLHLRQIQIDIDTVINLAPERHAEHFLRAKIIFERKALFVATPRGSQVVHRFLINWKISHRRAVFRRHVSDRRPIRNRQRRRAFAVKFDKFADDFLRTQQLGNVQDEIGRGDAFAQLAAHVHAHHFGREKVNRLPKHSGFRFNPAYAPAHHTETVDHRRVGIRADQCVGEVNS